MTLTKTPVCDFKKKADYFKLKSINNNFLTIDEIKGENGTLIMFICNHCPYVKAVIKNIVDDCNFLLSLGINSIAINSNDIKNYPEDSFEKMIQFSNNHNFNKLHYLLDEKQNIAKKTIINAKFFDIKETILKDYKKIK